MVPMENITIQVPVGMSEYLQANDSATEFKRNALLLYPYILNQTISHGKAAEILGTNKMALIDFYDGLGYSYFDMTMEELENDLETYRKLKDRGCIS